MKVNQEKLPASQIGLEIEIPPERSKQAYDQVIQNFSRAANIPGFRKGKVPRQILLQRLGTRQIKAAAVEELLKQSIEEALKQEEIAAIGSPQLTSSFDDLVSQYEPGKLLNIAIAVDVKPEVHLSESSGWHIKAEEVKYDPAKVEQVLAETRAGMATLIPVENRPAQIGDVAVVDFQGHLVPPADDPEAAPQEIPGGAATDFQVELQPGRFIEGFIDGIVGMNVGETKEVPAKFPDEYPQKDVAGRAATFTITLKELKEKELPELDDEFAEEVSEFKTLAQWRASLEAKFKAEAENQTKINKHEALVAELIKHLEVELPETMIAQQVDNLLTQTAVQLSRQGIDIKNLFTAENIPQFRERTRPEAIAQLRRALALKEVAKHQALQVEPAAIEQRVQELRAQYEGKDIDLEQLRQVVADELLTEKVMDWLEAHSTIELVPAGSLAETQSEIAEPDTEAVTSEVAPVVVEAADADSTTDEA